MISSTVMPLSRFAAQFRTLPGWAARGTLHQIRCVACGLGGTPGGLLILNLHERWLLRLIGVHRPERREMLTALVETGRSGGDVDLLAETGGFTLAKRSVRKDLPELFDQMLAPHGPPVHGIAYGDRRYRKPVILAAALHQAGVSVANYRIGTSAGYRTLDEFKTRAGSG